MIDYKHIKLLLPSGMAFTQAQAKEMQMLNCYVDIKFEKNSLLLSQASLAFNKIAFLELHFPFEISPAQYEEIGELNQNEIKKIEYSPQTLYIHMATIGFISAFSASILIALGLWNKKNRLGRIFDAQSDYILKQKDGSEKHRIPDISFISFKNLVDKIYDERGFITAKPYFIIEVVSRKYSLQQDLRKMQNDWLTAGMEVGLVVCPYRQKYFLFEKNCKTYKEFDFSKAFTHEKLPELELNFTNLLEEAKME